MAVISFFYSFCMDRMVISLLPRLTCAWACVTAGEDASENDFSYPHIIACGSRKIAALHVEVTTIVRFYGLVLLMQYFGT